MRAARELRVDLHIDEVDGAVNQEGESVQAALNSRLRGTTRLTFFDDESGNEDMQLEPDDFNIVIGLVGRRGWPEFSNATKLDGAWLGMFFKRGPLGMGYYRDIFKMEFNLAMHLPAAADATPVIIQMNEVVGSGPHKKVGQDEEPDTCP